MGIALIVFLIKLLRMKFRVSFAHFAKNSQGWSWIVVLMVAKKASIRFVHIWMVSISIFSALTDQSKQQ